MKISLDSIFDSASQADVIVVGGGSAGCFAAISASLHGAKTILIEKNGVLGGTAITAGVNFPGLFHAWGKQIIDGPCWKAILRAKDYGGAVIPKITYKPKDHWLEQISVNRFIYARVLDEFCMESNIDVRLHTMVSFAEESDEGVIILLTGKEGLSAVKAKLIIDATGDANIAGLMGYQRIKSENLQPATLINDIAGYDINMLDWNTIDKFYKEAIEKKQLFSEDFQGGHVYNSLQSHRISMHIKCLNADTSAAKTQMEIMARENLMRIIQTIKTFPGLENIFVSYFAEECGIRETYRIVGEKTVTADDYLSGKLYDDAVCFCFYPIDLHIPTGIKMIRLNDGIVPTIPYGALIPKGSSRVLAAGRCISGDTDSNSAYRVQAACMAMGQAAGVAAAIAASKNIGVSQVDHGELCDGLIRQGAIIPTHELLFIKS
jgi:hypothetical protein